MSPHRKFGGKTQYELLDGGNRNWVVKG